METMGLPVLIEIGIGKKSSSQIINYGNYRYGIIITSKLAKIKYDDTNKVLYIPLKLILLL